MGYFEKENFSSNIKQLKIDGIKGCDTLNNKRTRLLSTDNYVTNTAEYINRLLYLKKHDISPTQLL